VTNPALPKLNGDYGTPGIAWDVTVSEGFAYVVEDDKGLQILGFKGVAGFSIAASLSARGLYTLHVSFSNNTETLNTIFTMTVSERVRVKNKQSAESIALSEYGKSLSISFYPEQLFISYGVGVFLHFSSTSFPCRFQPTLSLATYNTPGVASGVVVSGSYAYVAEGSRGGLL